MVIFHGLFFVSSPQYNKQHMLPLEDVKLQSLENDGRKLCFNPLITDDFI